MPWSLGPILSIPWSLDRHLLPSPSAVALPPLDALSPRPHPLTQALDRNSYLIFVGLTFFFGWFTYNKVPETKGKSIAQVTKEFEKY